MKKFNRRVILLYVGFCAIIGIFSLVFLATNTPKVFDRTEDQIKSEAMIENYNKLVEKYPLVAKLPINVEYYRGYSEHIKYQISYRVEDEEAIIVIHDYTGNNKEKAFGNIRSRGFNPEDYTIDYLDESGRL